MTERPARIASWGCVGALLACALCCGCVSSPPPGSPEARGYEVRAFEKAYLTPGGELLVCAQGHNPGSANPNYTIRVPLSNIVAALERMDARYGKSIHETDKLAKLGRHMDGVEPGGWNIRIRSSRIAEGWPTADQEREQPLRRIPVVAAYLPAAAEGTKSDFDSLKGSWRAARGFEGTVFRAPQGVFDDEFTYVFSKPIRDGQCSLDFDLETKSTGGAGGLGGLTRTTLRAVGKKPALRDNFSRIESAQFSPDGQLVVRVSGLRAGAGEAGPCTVTVPMDRVAQSKYVLLPRSAVADGWATAGGTSSIPVYSVPDLLPEEEYRIKKLCAATQDPRALYLISSNSLVLVSGETYENEYSYVLREGVITRAARNYSIIQLEPALGGAPVRHVLLLPVAVAGDAVGATLNAAGAAAGLAVAPVVAPIVFYGWARAEN